MSTPSGYNNPAYCHQYDSSLYDYQYVPEIDPDSPDLREETNRRSNQINLVHPSFSNFRREPSESEEFEGSDESNRSIIIEECNNRRVTLICEKRSKTEANCEDGNFWGAYCQDISLESENGYESQGNKPIYDRRRNEERSHRHQRPLEPPVEQSSSAGNGSNYETRMSANPKIRQSTTSINSYQRPQRQHRYEEIPCGDDDDDDVDDYDPKPPSRIHRYAEISVDENGYPTLSKEIQIEQRNTQKENYPPRVSKPRAISPVSYPETFSPPPTPSRIYQRTSKPAEFEFPQFSPNSASQIIYSSSPIKTNSIEMSELSPPRLSNDFDRSGLEHTVFIRSPKRQPPIGASSVSDAKEPYPTNGRCILPKNLQEIKSGRDRSYSLPSSPKRRNITQIVSSPNKPQSDKKIPQIFHIKSSQGKAKANPRRKMFIEKENTPARRNISNAFMDHPKDSPQMMTRSPYKPTTTEIIPPKTAIITPIFQRKNQEGTEGSFSPKRNFERVSQAFQSTGNIFRSTREMVYPEEADLPPRTTQERMMSPARIKRNQSVPNFSQTLAAETRKNREIFRQENQKYSTNLDLQYSPKKPTEHLSIDKSRISLIDQSSWTSEFQPQCSTCFIFSAIVHLLTGAATCAITFYLLSKVGRRYYLDFGLLAGFVNFILGLLGFRSYCWRWLPNRNYVSGFIGLAAFSALTCAGLSYLITARPMAGDPILDILGGAICAVSVLTIVLALTGLTMSGCCKAPPPDNRVTDI